MWPTSLSAGTNVRRAVYLLPAKIQEFAMNGSDALTALQMTYFFDGFQPEGPFKFSRS